MNTTRVRDQLQELRELGAGGTAFRVAWELRGRSGLARISPTLPANPARPDEWVARLPWADPVTTAQAMRLRSDASALDALRATAHRAAHGVIRCFGAWDGDYGDPVDWHRNPRTGERWNPELHWSEVLRDAPRCGDVKLAWEAARFPQAFHFARAAAFFPVDRDTLFAAFSAQVSGFLASSQYPRGIHWFSNQEATIRLHAWLFAISVFAALGCDTGELAGAIAAYALAVGAHTRHEIAYAKHAVYNNHLVGEAFGLLLCAWIRPDAAESRAWWAEGRAILDREAERQFYPDGAYLNLSHTYHRVVLQDYLLAWRFLRTTGVAEMPPGWRKALERSLDFLVAHQCPADGSLPNHGANDGSMPRVLTSCEYHDFRPILQAASIAIRGVRLYEPGPWDEESAWLLGPEALDAPLKPIRQRSASFAYTGYHVLRSSRDASTFTAFRCGSMRDRFGHMDMLHVDLFHRGDNVLADGGTFLYNEDHRWHDHFLRSASHNTLTVDGHEQMLHFRRFKFLYWTHARLLRFGRDGDSWRACGEHSGFARHPGNPVHRRSVRLFDDGTLVVVDRIAGTGSRAHRARLHWLGGAFAFSARDDGSGWLMHAPGGDFALRAFNAIGTPLEGTVVAGADDPPRGWISRTYATKVPAPSFAAEADLDRDGFLVSVAGPAQVEVSVDGAAWSVTTGAGAHTIDPRRELAG